MGKNKSTGKKRKKGAVAVLKPSACPCGGGDYGQCCAPLHAGEREASGPEELMRSRYSAFAVHDAPYLWKTLHSAHDECDKGELEFCEQVESSFGKLRYAGLQVIEVRPPDAYGTAQVLFHAKIQQLNRDRSVVELSDFALEEGHWRYLAGVTKTTSELSHAPADMTIDHWQCGHDHHH